MAITNLLGGVAGNTIKSVGNFLGNPLPDWNLSESLQSYGGNSGSKFVWVPPVQTYDNNQDIGFKNDDSGGKYFKTEVDKNDGGGGGGGGLTNPYSNLSNEINRPDQSYGGNSNSEIDNINAEYNNLMNFWGDQENISQRNYENTYNKANSELNTAITGLEGERGLRQQELGSKAEGGRQTERLNLAKVNQLLQDLQQRDNARMAITGGGSTNEALSDRFARRAQSDIGNVLTESQRFQNDIRVEGERVEQFYANKKQDIRNQAQSFINEARLRLDDTLSRIRNERGAASNQKAQANTEAWKNYYNQVRQAKFEAANFDAQLSLWRQNMNQSLSDKLTAANIADQDINGVLGGFTNTTGTALASANQPMSPLPATRVNLSRRAEDEEQLNQPLFA